GVFAAMAMGAQSVLVRLLMKDIPQTNVMTGNMTQLGIAATEWIVARRRFDHSRHGEAAVRDFANARGRPVTVLAIAVGFLLGAAAGALAFATTGLHGALAAVAIVGALTLWALLRQEGGGNFRCLFFRAQGSTIRAFTRVFARYGGALRTRDRHKLRN